MGGRRDLRKVQKVGRRDLRKGQKVGRRDLKKGRMVAAKECRMLAVKADLKGLLGKVVPTAIQSQDPKNGSWLFISNRPQSLFKNLCRIMYYDIEVADRQFATFVTCSANASGNYPLRNVV